MAFGLQAQSLDPSITWATVEKITIPGGQDLLVSSGNDGRNLIQYWERAATLVIGDQLFFKASPPLPDTIGRIDTVFTTQIDTIALADAQPAGCFSLIVDTLQNGLSDSLITRCSQITSIDTTWNNVFIHQLWVTKGTGATTNQVPGTADFEEPMHLIEANGNLYFTAIDRNDATRYIYKFDGTATSRVSDYPNPYGLSQFGNEILFGVQGQQGYYTCITDANAPLGSRVISFDIGPTPNKGISTTTMQWSQYAPFQVITKRDNSGIQAIFYGKHITKGIEICVTDGQTANVILDINRDPDISNPDPTATLSVERGDIIIAVNKYQVAFRAVTPSIWGGDTTVNSFQQNMWITDGTASGTWLFEDQNRTLGTYNGLPATGNSFAGDPFLFKNRLYYTGSTTHDRQFIVMKNTYPNKLDSTNSREEWIINGPSATNTYLGVMN
jgi:hypothetical protein